MDKKQFFAVITQVYKHLAPTKISVFVKNEDSTLIRIISEAFLGMTFSARFKLLNEQFQKQQPELFNEKIYIFEAFTASEVAQINLDNHGVDSDESDSGFSESAKEL
jgi:hypothetical protein